MKHRPQGHQYSTEIITLRWHATVGGGLGASLRGGRIAGEHLSRGRKLRVIRHGLLKGKIRTP